MRFSWKTACKIAWRESRSSSFKFLFVILAVAVGVGSLTGVRGFSRAFHDMLLTQARTLMAADLSLRVFELPTPEQTAEMDALAKSGIDRTWITETVTMAAAGAGPKPPMLVSVKAVDPKKYPFYGEIRLSPPAPLSKALTSDTVAVSDDVLLRLKLKVGDAIRLGGQPFRIVGEVTYEPDRMLGSLNVGPRVMITRDGLERTGLMLPGSRAAERFLFRLSPRSPGIEPTRALLKAAFPDALIADYRESHPIVTQGLNRATTFLSLVSLITLIIGAIGVGTAMRAHIQQRMDSIAIMKCIGARSSHVMRIYLLQTIALGLAGGLLGVVFGLVVQRAFPSFLARYFELEPTAHWDFLTAAQGIGIAILASLLFTLPPLIGIRHIRPSLILRREMEETKPGWRTRLAEARASIASGRNYSAWIRRHRDVLRYRHAQRHLENRRILRWRAGRQLRCAVRRRLADAARVEDLEPPQTAVQRAARHSESVSSRRSRAIGAGGAGRRRDVHADGISGAARHDRRNESHLAARDAQRVPDRHRTQGSRCRSRSGQAAAGRGGDAGADWHRRRQADRRGWPGCSEHGPERFRRRYRSPRSVTSAGAMPDYVNLERGAWWSPPTGRH